MPRAWSVAHVGWLAAVLIAAGPAMPPAAADGPWDGPTAPRTTADPDVRATAGRAITPRSSSDGRTATVPGHPRSAGSWWGSLASLTAVVVMILLGAKLWKKHGPLAGAGLPTEAVEVLGRRVIDPRQSLYLVRLGSRILVLGSTPAGLTTLAEITERVEVDLLAGFCRPPVEDSASNRPRGFGALLDHSVWRAGASAASGDQGQKSPASTADDIATGHAQRRREEAHA
jgi:flagellar biogenesis protein FliO